MTSLLNPYLTFDGNAREAVEFYQSTFGGQLDLNTFADFGGPAEKADDIMHARLTTDAGFTLMAADTAPGQPFTPGNNYAVSLSGDDAAQLRGYWTALSSGGTVTMAMEQQPWGDEFGMCVDAFGVSWMVNITST